MKVNIYYHKLSMEIINLTGPNIQVPRIGDKIEFKNPISGGTETSTLEVRNVIWSADLTTATLYI